MSLHWLMMSCALAESLCICSRPHECWQDCGCRVCLCAGHAALYKSSVHIPHQDHLQPEVQGLHNRQIRGEDLFCYLANCISFPCRMDSDPMKMTLGLACGRTPGLYACKGHAGLAKFLAQIGDTICMICLFSGKVIGSYTAPEGLSCLYQMLSCFGSSSFA